MGKETFTKQEVLDILNGIKNKAIHFKNMADKLEENPSPIPISIGSTAYWTMEQVLTAYIENIERN